MNSKFWQSLWQNKRIGFNQSITNSLLTTYFSALPVPVGGRVFVPLCGKSIDMRWLAEQGYDVVGVELVESAVQEFFAEQNITPIMTQHPDHPNIKGYQGQLHHQTTQQTLTLWVGDIFALTATDIGHVDAIYDRAALIALPSDMRPKYSEHVRRLSHNAPQLLLTLSYNEGEWTGPPFSVSCEQVQQYYSAHYSITELQGSPSTFNAYPDRVVMEYVWLLEQK